MRPTLSVLGLPALAFATIALLALTGCDTEPRQVGAISVQGSVTTYNYYAETLEDMGGRKRFVLFLDPATVAAWNAGAKELPLSRTYIGKGPNKETILVEQVKDGDQSKIITRRLLATFNAKHGTSIPLP